MRAGSSRSSRCSGFAWEQSLQRAFLALPDLVRGAEHLLLRRALPLHRDLLRLALPPLARRLHRLPRRLPRGDGDRGRDPLAASRRRRRGSRASGSRTRCCCCRESTSARQTSSALSNPVAAVPSLHAAYALGVGIGMIRFARAHLARLAACSIRRSSCSTIIVTGNHFLLDAVAGMLVLAVGFMLVRALAAVAASNPEPAPPDGRARESGASLHSMPRRGVEQPGSSPGS